MSGVIRIDYTITRGDLARGTVDADNPVFSSSSKPVTDVMYVSVSLDPFNDAQTWKMLVGGLLHHRVVRDLTNGP